MTPGDQTRLIIAIATNLGVAQLAAKAVGLPRWAGTLIAGASMAVATQPDALPEPVRGAVQIIVLPGNLVAQALDDKAATLSEGSENGL